MIQKKFHQQNLSEHLFIESICPATICIWTFFPFFVIILASSFKSSCNTWFRLSTLPAEHLQTNWKIGNRIRKYIYCWYWRISFTYLSNSSVSTINLFSNLVNKLATLPLPFDCPIIYEIVLKVFPYCFWHKGVN